MMVIALLNEMAFKNSVDLGAGLGGFSFFEVDLAEIASLAWVLVGGGDVTADMWIFSKCFIIGLKDQERCFSEISSGEGSSSYSSLSLQVGLKGRVGWGRRKRWVMWHLGSGWSDGAPAWRRRGGSFNMREERFLCFWFCLDIFKILIILLN